MELSASPRSLDLGLSHPDGKMTNLKIVLNGLVGSKQLSPQNHRST
jgi:hypothetical protein